jgi:predicted secreted protein
MFLIDRSLNGKLKSNIMLKLILLFNQRMELQKTIIIIPVHVKRKVYIMKLVKILIIFVFLAFITFPVFSEENKITVNVGDKFKIGLKSNPTTGYQWQLAEPLNNIELVSSKYIPPNTNLVGAGGKEIWLFKAIKAGKTYISFKYVRPWESKQPEIQKIYVIEIKDKTKLFK